MTKGARRKARQGTVERPRSDDPGEWFFPWFAYVDAEARMNEMQRAVAAGRWVSQRVDCRF